tara:strand:+ start:31 stop:594 length:564 start_codon:yes stop_codon:yes gene_type:complete
MSYDTGTVYKIICNLEHDFCYIGSTFNELRHRFQDHKKHYKIWLNNGKKKCSCFDYFQKYGIENFTIIKIKEYVCYRSHKLDKKQLHAYEQLWINKTRCCNKLPAFNPIKREKQKEYREKKKEYDKEYREDNKEQLKEQRKEYREKNKEQIKEKASQKITCDKCGAIIRKDVIARHQKTDKCISFSN